MLKKLGLKQPYTYRFSGGETSALALRAVLAFAPQDIDTMFAVKNWLLIRREKEGWQNTKTTALVLRALMEDEIISKNSTSTDFKLLTNLTEGGFESFEFNQQNLYAPERKLKLKSNIPQTLHLEK